MYKTVGTQFGFAFHIVWLLILSQRGRYSVNITFWVFRCFPCVLNSFCTVLITRHKAAETQTNWLPVHISTALHVVFSASDSYKVFFPAGLYFKLLYKADAHFPYPRVVCAGLQL